MPRGKRSLPGRKFHGGGICTAVKSLLILFRALLPGERSSHDGGTNSAQVRPKPRRNLHVMNTASLSSETALSQMMAAQQASAAAAVWSDTSDDDAFEFAASASSSGVAGTGMTGSTTGTLDSQDSPGAARPHPDRSVGQQHVADTGNQGGAPSPSPPWWQHVAAQRCVEYGRCVNQHQRHQRHSGQ